MAWVQASIITFLRAIGDLYWFTSFFHTLNFCLNNKVFFRTMTPHKRNNYESRNYVSYIFIYFNDTYLGYFSLLLTKTYLKSNLDSTRENNIF